MTTNSKLATYKNLTNKHSSRNGKKITKICIHHMAAVWTAKQAADYFASTKRLASANYCVGYEGSIAQNVDEAYRAWTTSNYWVDSQAVTVEVSNIKRGGNWPISNASLEALINLVVDIAERNDIYPVTYTGDKRGTLQKHQWYAKTNCPGPYLGSKFPYIAKEATRRLDLRRKGKSQSATVTPGYKKENYKKPIAVIASEVLAGKWGNGATRRKRLEAAGYDYNQVQREVNRRL